MICKTVLFLLEMLSYKSLTELAKALKQKTVRLRAVFCRSNAVGSWGLGMLNPQQVLPCIYRAELALPYATLMEQEPASVGRH